MTAKRVRPDFPARLPTKLAFVGEAPGDVEMMDGRPLVGPSGRTFNQMLRSANLRREDYLVTNVFDVQAPDNEIGAWTVNRKEAEARGWVLEGIPDFAGRYFEPEFIQYHLNRLSDELHRAGATVIVPMGGTALWALTGETSITVSRGAVDKSTRLIPGTKLLPTLHPAAVMREWKFFHVTVADFMKAAALAEQGPDLAYTKRQLWIDPNLRDLENFGKKFINKSSLLSIDIETFPSRRQINCVGFAPDPVHAIVIPFVDWRQPNRSYWKTIDDELRAWDVVRDWCGLPVEKVMQNGTYDAYWLWDVAHIPVLNYRHDTRLLHHALYPEMPKDLAFMGASYTDQGPWKRMRQTKKEKKDD